MNERLKDLDRGADLNRLAAVATDCASSRAQHVRLQAVTGGGLWLVKTRLGRRSWLARREAHADAGGRAARRSQPVS